MVPRGVEHSEPTEHVEVALALVVVEVGVLAAPPTLVEADRAQHPHELRVDRTGVEIVLVARARCEQVADRELGHAQSLASRACQPGPAAIGTQTEMTNIT